MTTREGKEVTVLPVLEQLKTLQAVDRDLARHQDLLARKKASLGQSEQAVKDLEQEVERARVRVQEVKKEAAGHELKLRENEAEIDKLNGQLNTVKTNKEYSLILERINGLKADNAMLEEEVLTVLERADQEEKSRQASAKKLEARKGQHAKENSELDRECAQLVAAIEELKQKRTRAAAILPREELARYERVLKLRNVALSPVVNEVCQGCFMQVTSQDINLLMLREQLVACRHCGRILYLE